jgi:hypothetical protein
MGSYTAWLLSHFISLTKIRIFTINVLHFIYFMSQYLGLHSINDRMTDELGRISNEWWWSNGKTILALVWRD